MESVLNDRRISYEALLNKLPDTDTSASVERVVGYPLTREMFELEETVSRISVNSGTC